MKRNIYCRIYAGVIVVFSGIFSQRFHIKINETEGGGAGTNGRTTQRSDTSRNGKKNETEYK